MRTHGFECLCKWSSLVLFSTAQRVNASKRMRKNQSKRNEAIRKCNKQAIDDVAYSFAIKHLGPRTTISIMFVLSYATNPSLSAFTFPRSPSPSILHWEYLRRYRQFIATLLARYTTSARKSKNIVASVVGATARVRCVLFAHSYAHKVQQSITNGVVAPAITARKNE